MNNISNHLATIQEIVEANELMFVSESDYEVNAFVVGRKIATLTLESFRQANPHLQYVAIENRSFYIVTTRQGSSNDGWIQLRNYFEENLLNPIVFITGNVRREVYIVGWLNHHIIGVRSFAIET